MNIQDWFLLGLTGLISLKSKGLLESFPMSQFINSLALSFLYSTTLTTIHEYWKMIALTRWTSVGKVMSLLFNMLTRLVIILSSKEQASFNFMAAVTICSDFGAQESKLCHCFHCFPIYLPKVMGPVALILVFWMLSFKSTFSLSSFIFIKRFFSSSSLLALRVMSSAYLRLLIFIPAILVSACASSSLAFCMMYSAYKLSRVTIYSFDVLLSQFGTSLLFHIQV